MRDVANKKNFIKSTYFLIVLVLCLVGVTYSWYSMMANTQMNEVEMSTPDATSILISTDGNKWLNSVDLSECSIENPICGNGNVFYKPNYTLINNDYEITSFDQISDSNASGSYIMFDYSIKCDSSTNTLLLKLSTTSYISPATETVNIDNRSPYNVNLNTGYIAAATRIAFYLEENDQYNLKCIWIPNAKYELTSVTTIDINGNVEDSYIFTDSISSMDITSTTILTSQSSNSYLKTNSVLYIWADSDELDNCPEICTLTSGIYNMKMIIWLEGTDRECDKALVGGSVNMHIGFDVL